MQVSRDAKHVGKFISTKAVASNSRDDVTLEYKHSEGTIEERIAFSSIGGSVTGKYKDSLFNIIFTFNYTN